MVMNKNIEDLLNKYNMPIWINDYIQEYIKSDIVIFFAVPLPIFCTNRFIVWLLPGYKIEGVEDSTLTFIFGLFLKLIDNNYLHSKILEILHYLVGSTVHTGL